MRAKAARAVPPPKPASDAAVLSKAVVRAARLLSFSQRELARILGVSEATASRLVAGSYRLSSARTKEWELALLLVRLFRSLDALWGHEAAAHTWLSSDNLALAARPGRSPPFRRRPRSCRQLPGQRARSPLTPAALRHALWRAVEAQHVVSTMALVDSIEEQHVLERLLDETKPSIPAAAAHLHWLLFTPFRYPPPPGGSRFRGPNDPGVFYGADEIRTACAELGYWRWRHLHGFAGARGDADQAANGVPGEDRDRRGRPSREAVRARSAALDRRRRLFALPGVRPHGARGAASARSATSRSAIRSTRRAARCWRPPRSLLRVRSSSRRGCCRSPATASSGSARTRSMPKSTNSPPRNGRRPRARPHRVRADVARDAGVHGGARTPTTPRRDLAHRASAGLHARPRRPARAPAARQRHPDDQGRPRRTDHLSRARAARRLSALRSAAARSSACARWSGRIEAAVVEWLDSLGIAAYGKPAAPGVYTVASRRRGEDRRARVAGAPTAARITASRSTSRWISRPSPTSTRAATAGSRSRSSPISASPRPSSGAGAELAPILAARLRTARPTMDEPAPVRCRTPPASSTRATPRRARIPHQDRPGRAAEEARLDSRARAVVAALRRDQADPARAQPAHGVRGSLVPEHRRVLLQGHGDVHDHGRHLHAALPVLRRRPRPPAAARRRRARESRADDRRARARVRRDHERGSRRPARRRRAAFRRLHPRGARALAGNADRSAGPRFPRPPRARARHPRRGAARRDEPQSRDGAAALPAGAARIGLRAFADAARASSSALPGDADQVRPDGGPRRDRRRNPRRRCATCARTTSTC